MDILTPKGQRTVREEDDAVDLFTRRFPQYAYARTPKDMPSPVDAILIKDGLISAVVETKCRQMTMETFVGAFKMEWLVTGQKIEDGVAIAKALCVSYVGFLYLVPDKTLLVAKVWDGDYITPIRWARTETQATVNGGIATRVNAFINMSKATEINYD
jgi:hypothetical protein